MTQLCLMPLFYLKSVVSCNSVISHYSAVSHNIAQTRAFPACQEDVTVAADMYRKSVAWREQKGIDLLNSWDPPDVLKKYFPGGFAGFDQEGCPVWIIPFGQADMKGK